LNSDSSDPVFFEEQEMSLRRIEESSASESRRKKRKSVASAPNSARPFQRNPDESIFPGGGEMGERIRSLDWSKTVLGSVDRWPESLETTVRICLGSRNPIVV
jgi:hypothetical protein